MSNFNIYSNPNEQENNSCPNRNNESQETDKLKVLESKLEKQRKDWELKIRNLASQIKDINKLNSAQVDMLSYRQIVIELLTNYRIKYKKLKSAYSKKYKSKFIEYFNFDYKISDKLKVDMVESDLSDYIFQYECIDAQIDFFKECINTLDKIGYAIKNRVNFEEI